MKVEGNYHQPCAELDIRAPKSPPTHLAWKPHPWVSGSRPAFLANGTCVSVWGGGGSPKETEGYYDSLFIPPPCLSQENKKKKIFSPPQKTSAFKHSPLQNEGVGSGQTAQSE